MENFKKQFLHKDVNRIEAIINDYQKVLDKYNELLPKVEKAIRQKLSEEQKDDIINRQGAAVLSVVRPQFKFVDASDDFNLQALGLQLNDVLHELNNLPSVYSRQLVKEGRFVLSEDFVNEITEQNTIYTKNERQNKALRLAEKFCKMFKEADELSALDHFGKHNPDKVLKIVHRPFGSNEIVANHNFISTL